MAEQAVNVIYKLAENPDAICEDILKKITNIVLTYAKELEPEAQTNEQNEEANKKVDDQPEAENAQEAEDNVDKETETPSQQELSQPETQGEDL